MKQELLQSITGVDKELAKLDKERQRLFDSIRERRLLLGALRRMPKEVLAHIFFHTLVFPFHGYSPSGTLANWAIVNVFCSRHPTLII